MDIYKTELFPFIQGKQLAGRNFDLTIKGVVGEILPNHKGEDERKFVVYFKETTKGLILNKTNAQALADLFGPETDAWSGKRINLYTEKVRAFGKTHDAVRARAAQNGKSPANGAKPETPIKAREIPPEPSRVEPEPEPESDGPSPMDEVEAVDREAQKLGRSLSGEEQRSLFGEESEETDQAERDEAERYYTEA